MPDRRTGLVRAVAWWGGAQSSSSPESSASSGMPSSRMGLVDHGGQHAQARRAEPVGAQGDSADVLVAHGCHHLDLRALPLGLLLVEEIAGIHSEEPGQRPDCLHLRVGVGPGAELLDGAGRDGHARGAPNALRHLRVRVRSAPLRVHLPEQVVEQLREGARVLLGHPQLFVMTATLSTPVEIAPAGAPFSDTAVDGFE